MTGWFLGTLTTDFEFDPWSPDHPTVSMPLHTVHDKGLRGSLNFIYQFCLLAMCNT